MVYWKIKRFAGKIQIEQTSTVLEPSSPFPHYLNLWLLKIVRMYLIWIHNNNVINFHCIFQIRFVYMKPTVRTCSLQLTTPSSKASCELVNTVSNFMSLSKTKLFKTNRKINQKKNRCSYSSRPNCPNKIAISKLPQPNLIQWKANSLPFNHARTSSESRNWSNSQDRFILNNLLDFSLA